MSSITNPKITKIKWETINRENIWLSFSCSSEMAEKIDPKIMPKNRQKSIMNLNMPMKNDSFPSGQTFQRIYM